MTPTAPLTDSCVRLVLTDLAANSNKFWNAEVIGSALHVTFGRVGEAGKLAVTEKGTPEKAQKYLLTKIHEKERKGYTRQRTEQGLVVAAPSKSLEHIAHQQIAKDADHETQKLVAFLAARNIHAIEGATSIRLSSSGSLTTPLGTVTPDGVEEATVLLDRIGLQLGQRSPGAAFPGLVNDYLRIVPRDFGRRKMTARDIFPNEAAVAKEVAVLDALRQALKDAAATATDSLPEIFRCKLVSITRDSDEWIKVHGLYVHSRNRHHTSSNMRLEKVWTMSVGPADDAFEADGKKVGNIKTLWHGTQDSNLLSILRAGYIIPNRGGSIKITGRMYGNGIYFSDQSTKSLNYATGFWGGNSGRCFMMLNDVAMGREYRPSHSFSDLPPKGYDSCFAKAGQSGVLNNEMIVYRASQARPAYLCEFK